MGSDSDILEILFKDYWLLDTTRLLRMELHCHNVFSNNMNSSPRIPFDCGVNIEDQLMLAYEKKIDVIFITNHNTINGYRQILEYKENHEKFKNINIYPAEEITINTKGHVLAYGIHDTIKPGMDIDETLDEIRKQNAVSCAAHPFAVSNGVRENAIKCDMIESFNSNNIDHYSNIVSEKFCSENNMISISRDIERVEAGEWGAKHFLK